MPETPLFDNNNNCLNYTTSQLKTIYQSDTPVIVASLTKTLAKKRKRQRDDSVCYLVKKLKNDTELTLCNWCVSSYKGINRHRNFCISKPTDIVREAHSKTFVIELL